MRTFVRWVSVAAATTCCLVSSVGCKTAPWSTPGASFATWGKKDANSLAATKPSPNFPSSPSKNATPNPTSTAALNGGTRSASNSAIPSAPGGANPGANSGQGYPISAFNNNGSAPGSSDRGFYSSTPPGATQPGGNLSKWDNANSGYLPSSTAVQKSGYDYQPASLRGNEYGSPGNGYDASTAGGEYGGQTPRATNDGASSQLRNPYASQPSRPAPYGSHGHDEAAHGHNHDHDHGDSGYPSPSGYGSPSRGNTGYDSPARSAYGEPGGGFSSRGAAPGTNELSIPSGLSQRGNGYLPGSTRRSVGGPASIPSMPDSFESPADVKPVGFENADPSGDSYSADANTGGSFGEPGDEFPGKPPARFGSSPGGSYDPR